MKQVEFKLAEHSMCNVQIIEVWIEGVFRAAIYPDDEGGIRIISGHLRADPTHVFRHDPDVWQFLFKED